MENETKTKQVRICFNKKTEQDILDFFETHENKIDYIRKLILEDMETNERE